MSQSFLRPVWTLGLALASVLGAQAPPWGEYRLPSGRTLTLQEVGVLKTLARPTFLDGETHRMGALQQDGPSRFWTTADGAPQGAVQTELTLQRDAAGAVTGLRIAEQGQPLREAVPVTLYQAREVQVRNRDVTLAGLLRTPAGPGPFPAVVLVHGSGPGTRHQVAMMACFFARLGMASLAYDKRGCGDSTGDWRTVGLDALAGDAEAAVRWLQAQPGIDPKRVGAYGISQGGWVVSLVGARSRAAAFLINHSGPATSLRRQDTYMTTNLLVAAGFEPQGVALALKALNTLYDYGQGRASREAMGAALREAQAHPQAREVIPWTLEDLTPERLYRTQAIGDPAWFFHLDPDHDALAAYRQLRAPLLVVYGGRDATVPVAESRQRLQETLAQARHPDYELLVLEEAGHGPARMRADAPTKPQVPLRADPAFYDRVASWLRSRALIPGAARPSAPPTGP